MQTETDNRPMADRVRLIGEAGEDLGWAPEEQVRRWLKEGQVELLGTRKRVRTARVLRVQQFDNLIRLEGSTGRRRVHGQPASHNHETETNPKGVWTFRAVKEWPRAETRRKAA